MPPFGHHPTFILHLRDVNGTDLPYAKVSHAVHLWIQLADCTQGICAERVEQGVAWVLRFIDRRPAYHWDFTRGHTI